MATYKTNQFVKLHTGCLNEISNMKGMINL